MSFLASEEINEANLKPKPRLRGALSAETDCWKPSYNFYCEKYYRKPDFKNPQMQVYDLQNINVPTKWALNINKTLLQR